ncbi:DEAD/DEAH box helicase [Mucilaginibacter sp.]|uniref:DEAD/DEAH box helicase n=1 Tax=Mucilaginibacter sp. TaxID=1882438 RepID=UPI000CC765F9|nr:DEAD/DEAH box helicase [Mucilaginibacter sp.]PLW88856.1 MAG: DEAD/DEAH box helicase [Mucilaginibacter sp.]HEK21003.1 DEAD/DEAH box helicase [Bacteroidota bacterium]
MLFTDLKLIEPILKALQTEGYTSPTPIQQQAIPYILQRRDLLGCAQTGTGKTAAFAIPTLQLLYNERQQHREQKTIKALVLTPTRELAIQISDSFTAYGRNTGLKNLVIFGGVSQNPQVDALRKGVDILVATPGRLLDLMNQGYVHINQIKMLILDEADRMLDMGFVNDVKKILAKVPAKRQTLFFSATMPKEIQSLADSILNNPEKVEVAPVSSTADTIQQAIYFVEKSNKKNLLIHILKDKNIKTLLVFTRTKHGADKVVKDLHKAGITAEAIHGNKSQNARQRALTNFKNRTTRVLIATDIAARGIDIDELSHVVNYELPNIPETYVHRIGRTGRAGASGIAMSFCDGEEEIEYLKDINKLIGKQVPIEEGHPYPLSIELMNARMTGKAVSISVKGKAPAGESRGGRNGGANRGRNNRGGNKSANGESRHKSGSRKAGSKTGGTSGSGMSGRR